MGTTCERKIKRTKINKMDNGEESGISPTSIEIWSLSGTGEYVEITSLEACHAALSSLPFTIFMPVLSLF
jgi:hypothetical protein